MTSRFLQRLGPPALLVAAVVALSFACERTPSNVQSGIRPYGGPLQAVTGTPTSFTLNVGSSTQYVLDTAGNSTVNYVSAFPGAGGPVCGGGNYWAIHYDNQSFANVCPHGFRNDVSTTQKYDSVNDRFIVQFYNSSTQSIQIDTLFPGTLDNLSTYGGCVLGNNGWFVKWKLTLNHKAGYPFYYVDGRQDDEANPNYWVADNGGGKFLLTLGGDNDVCSVTNLTAPSSVTLSNVVQYAKVTWSNNGNSHDSTEVWFGDVSNPTFQRVVAPGITQDFEIWLSGSHQYIAKVRHRWRGSVSGFVYSNTITR